MLQQEMLRNVDEAEQRIGSVQRKLLMVEEDDTAEIMRLKAKMKGLEQAAINLSSTLTELRHKYQSTESEKDATATALCQKTQQVSSLEEQLVISDAKHVRELQRVLERSEEADGRADSLFSECSDLRHRCDALEMYKRQNDSKHQLDTQDLQSALAAALRDKASSHAQMKEHEAEVVLIVFTYLLLAMNRIIASICLYLCFNSCYCSY